MTFVLAIMSDEYGLQISDRRLTAAGRPLTEEEGKAIQLMTADSRFAVAYAGLAKVGTFSLRRWLMAKLLDIAEPDYSGTRMIERLSAQADIDAELQGALASVGKATRTIELIFTGYYHALLPPRPVMAIVSNKEYDFSGTKWSDDGRFRFMFYSTPNLNDYVSIHAIGWLPALKQIDLDLMAHLCRKKLPVNTIKRQMIKTMHEISDRADSNGTVGKQLDLVVIPRSTSEAIYSEYTVGRTNRVSYIPDIVFAMSPDDTSAVTDLAVEPVDASTTPISMPTLGRNERCWCGSGLKHKRCHGR